LKERKEKKREKGKIDKKVKKKRKAQIFSSDEDEPMPQKVASSFLFDSISFLERKKNANGPVFDIFRRRRR